MKISKYRHARTAVGEINKDDSKRIGGLIYEHPGNNLNTEKRIIGKSNSIKILYNFFTPIQAGTEPTKPDPAKFDDQEIYQKRLKNYEVKKANYDRRNECVKASIIQKLNIQFSNLIFKNEEKKPKVMLDINAIISNMKKGKLNELFSGTLTPEDVVTLALRKSLRNHKEGAISFIRCSGLSNITIEDQCKIEEFLDAVRVDFGKLDPDSEKSQVALIKRSIDNQNLVVQTVGGTPGNETFGLSISVQTDKKKEYKINEKKALNEFLSLYADLHEDQRMEYLRKIRRIIDLYFAAPDSFDKDTVYQVPDAVDQSDFNVWSKHEDGKNEEGSFVCVPSELKNSWETKSKLDSVKEKELTAELVKVVRSRNIICYRYSVSVTSNSNADVFFSNNDVNIFWIHHIENAVERILRHRLCDTPFKLDIAYLRERVWKDALNFISIKYIAIGKTVFHFGMEDLLSSQQKQEILVGLNSFDLEMIKARETLQREMAVYVAFAANNLARNAVKQVDAENMEDILLWNENDISENKKYVDSEDEVKSVLQFFGGRSQWDTKMISDAYGEGKYSYDVRFVRDLAKNIYSLRNESFHFVTLKDDAGKWNTGLIGKMFEKEAKDCTLFEKRKFYSNNLPMFYKDEDLEGVLNAFYGHASQRPSQIPAFGRIVARKELHTFMTEMGIVYPAFDAKILEKWENACYYLLKEAYYNAFLGTNELKNLFKEALNNLNDTADNELAVKDFRERCNKLIDKDKLSISKLCQNIMTEYNLQNNSKRKADSSNDSVMDDRIFKHYKLFLEKTLGNAFREYIRSQSVYGFLLNPVIREMPAEENFLPEWSSNMYEKLINEVTSNPALQKWYITCRFLNGRSLNMLIGSMRSYVQFVGDIRTRAQKTHNWMHKDEKDNAENIRKAINVVEMCIRLADRFSNEVEDYFAGGPDEYAHYLGRYIDYGSFSGNDVSDLNKLRIFCNDPDIPDQIYMDKKKLIVNRNILMAKLYGDDSILSEIIVKIDKDKIQEYANKRKEIENYIRAGKCNNSKEQKAVLDYQSIKNRIELRDVAEYSEVTNELLGQLLNWSFLRERDLLYFQLGFHYMCLHNNTVKPEMYVRIDSGNRSFDNVILRQIAGMYINGIGVFCADDNGDIKEQSVDGGIGGKVGSFIRYSKQIVSEEYGNKSADLLYNAGLEVFEVVSEHEAIIDTRDAIDHFKYYYKNAGSLLDLYSEVFDRFFTYDMKYRKNVPNILRNILLKHNVIIEPAFGTGEKIKEKKSKEKKSCAQIRVREISSDRFTYKIPAIEKELEIDAKDKEYMDTILKLLYYPDSKPDRLVPKVRAPKEKPLKKKKGGNDKKKN